MRRPGSRAALLLLAGALFAGLAPGAAQAQTAQIVDSDWALIPSGVTAGQSFRLLFVTSTSRNAQSSNIGDYNSFVQGRANVGHTAIRGFSGQFRALISTPSVHARDNTATTGAGVPIYWLSGAKVADNYADFYDGNWDSNSPLNESGGTVNVVRVWTGSGRDGTRSPQSARPGTNSLVRYGVPNNNGEEIDSSGQTAPGQRRLYGLSPVITVLTPGKVTDVTVDRVTHNSIRVRWTKPAEASAALITDFGITTRERNAADTGWGDWVLRANVGAGVTSRVVTGLPSDARQQVRVYAFVRRTGESTLFGADSDYVEFTTAENVAPSAPAAPTVSATANSHTSLDVSWSAPANDGSAITGYDLQYRAGTTGGFTDGPQDVTGTSATIAGLQEGTSYQVQVRATNAAGDSGWSASGTGTTTADTEAPTLSSAAVNGATLTLTYDEALDTGSVPASSAFTVTVGGGTRTVSSVSIAGSAVTLTLASAVAAGDTVTLDYTAPSSNPIQDEAGNEAGDLSGEDVTNATSGGIVLSTATLSVLEGSSATYTVRLGSVPSGNVTVTVARAPGGSTDVTFDTDGNTSGDQSTLTFTTTNWQTAQTVTVSAAQDSDTTNDSATLTHTASGGGYDSQDASLAVTVTDDDGPTVRSVGLSDPASGDTFRYGETITVQVQYNSRLTVTGTPRLALTIGTATRYATFSRVGNNIVGRGIVQFTYRVQVGDHDTDGISVAGPIELNGGTMQGRQDLSGAAGLTLGTHAISSSTDHKVDARTSVTSIQISSEQPTGGTYRAGGRISVGVILDRTVWVSGGTPRLALEVGTATRYATFVGRESFSSGTTTLNFDYTVQAGDSDMDGIAIPPGAIDLNGAVLRDARPTQDDPGNALTLTLAYAGLPAQSGHKVDAVVADTTPPALSTATPPSVNGTALTLTYDEALDTGSVPAASDFTVRVGGATRALAGTNPVTIAGSAVTLTLASAVTHDQAVTVAYTVPTDAGANPIRDEAGNDAATFAARTATNATPGILLSVSTLAVAEGGSGTYTVRLNAAPSADVTVTITSDNTDVTVDDTDGETDGDQNALTFTTTNWSAAQTVTVRAAEDADTANDRATLTHAIGGAAEYDSLADPTVSVTVTDDEPPPPSNRAPTAEAGTDRTVDAGASVTLSGSGSDPDGDDLTYSWAQTGGTPDVTLSGADTAGASFTAPADLSADAALVFTLTVSDGTDDTTDTVTVTVTAGGTPPPPSNRAPTAEAGADRTVDAGASVTLSGSGSDPDGDDLTYSWAQTGGTPDVTLSGADTANASFTAPADLSADAALVFTLTVSDGSLSATGTVTVTVSAPNRAPTAEAGADRTVDAGASVTLSGSGSDPDGDDLTYSWAQTGGTPAVTLSGADTANASFTAPADLSADAALVFTLTVSDGTADATDTVTVTVTAPPPNRAPATEGTIADRTLESGAAAEIGVAGFFSDPDGDELSYTASSTNAAVAAVSVSDASLALTPGAAGRAMVTVTASDGSLSAMQSFAVTVAAAAGSVTVTPMADADGEDGGYEFAPTQAGESRVRVATEDGTAQAVTVEVGEDVPAQVTVTLPVSEAARVDRLEIIRAAGGIPALGRSSGFRLGSIVLDITLRSGSMVVQPLSAVTVCVPVSAELADTAEADLALYHYADGAWTALDARVAVREGVRRLCAATDSLSLFAVAVRLSGEAGLQMLTVTAGGQSALNESFAPERTDYTADAPAGTVEVTVEAAAADGGAAVALGGTAADGAALEVNGAVLSGLARGVNTVEITVTAEDGRTVRTYRVEVTVEAQAVEAVRRGQELEWLLSGLGRTLAADALDGIGRRLDPPGPSGDGATPSGSGATPGESGVTLAGRSLRWDSLSWGSLNWGSLGRLGAWFGAGPRDQAGPWPGGGRPRGGGLFSEAGGEPALQAGGDSSGAQDAGRPGAGAAGFGPGGEAPNGGLADANAGFGAPPPGSTGGDFQAFLGHLGVPDVRDLLSNSAFELALSEGGEDGTGGFGLWGRGSVSEYQGRPGDGFAVDGELRTGYLGLDYRFGGRGLMGVALARSWGEVGYEGASAAGGARTGTFDTSLTSVLPYAAFSPRAGLSLWGMLGAGRGDAELTEALGASAAERAEADLTMRMAGLGVRGELFERGSWTWAVKADAFAVRMETDAALASGAGSPGAGLPGAGLPGADLSAAGLSLPGAVGEARRARLLMAGRGEWALSEHGRLVPEIELGARYDGGGAETGPGAELGAGVAYANARLGLGIEARARVLLAHRDEAYEEWGASVTVRLDPGADGRGLSLSLSPVWGNALSGVEALWQGEGMLMGAAGGWPAAGTPEARRSARPDRMEMRLGYGLEAFGGLLTPYGEWGSAEGARRMQLGMRLGLWKTPGAGDATPDGLRLELALERQQRLSEPPQYGILLRFAGRFGATPR